MAFHFLVLLSSLLLPAFSLAQYPSGCGSNNGTLYFNFFSDGPLNSLQCNIDPSQANEQFTLGVEGFNCATEPLVVQEAVAYDGTDGMQTTASATAVTILPTSTYSFFIPVTDLPYSSLSGVFSDFFAVTFASSEIGTFTLYITQSFSQTIFSATITSTSTVPSTSTSTSTITDQLVTSASPVTVTASAASGVATVYASPKTTTRTRTITRPRSTSTSFAVQVVTTTLSCRPTTTTINSPHLSPKNLAARFDKRQYTTIPANAQIEYCGTPVTNTTVFATIINTATTTIVETDYTATTITTTYTETDTLYIVKPSKTRTITHTYTDRRTIFTGHLTTTVTRPTTITETTYKKGAKPCTRNPLDAKRGMLLFKYP